MVWLAHANRCVSDKTGFRTVFLKNSFRSSFVRAGTTSSRTRVPASSLLDGSTDWCMSVDYKHKKAIFPPLICATDERPDIVLWSESSRRVLLLELTCPAEEGIEAARLRKESRYAPLLTLIESTRCWTPELFTLEIGARGLVACRTFKLFRSLGFESSEANALCRSLSLVSSRCSYAIHCAHSLNAWIPRGLIRAPPPAQPLPWRPKFTGCFRPKTNKRAVVAPRLPPVTSSATDAPSAVAELNVHRLSGGWCNKALSDRLACHQSRSTVCSLGLVSVILFASASRQSTQCSTLRKMKAG